MIYQKIVPGTRRRWGPRIKKAVCLIDCRQCHVLLTQERDADIHLDSPLRGLFRYESTPNESLRNACRRAYSIPRDLFSSRFLTSVSIECSDRPAYLCALLMTNRVPVCAYAQNCQVLFSHRALVSLGVLHKKTKPHSLKRNGVSDGSGHDSLAWSGVVSLVSWKREE